MLDYEQEHKMHVYPLGFNGNIKDKVLNHLKELQSAIRMALKDKLQREMLVKIGQMTQELKNDSDFEKIEQVFKYAKILNNIVEYSEDKFGAINNFINQMMLTEEEIAVIFAQTSRSPANFDENAQKVTKEKAADFHKKWTLTVEGYGHSSIAEHAILHIAIEKISTLACDKIEEARLASFTEQSGRYQVIAPGYYYKPKEIMEDKKLADIYIKAQDACFETYEKLLSAGMNYIKSPESYKKYPERRQKNNEKTEFHNIRLRKIVTDAIKQLFGPSRLTNVGITINSRNLEYMIKKMLSHPNPEIQNVGQILKKEGLKITPTLIHYAQKNKYLSDTHKNRYELSKTFSPDYKPIPKSKYHLSELLNYEKNAEDRLISAYLYQNSGDLYDDIYKNVKNMKVAQKEKFIDKIFGNLEKYDIPDRSVEFATDYLFEFYVPHGIYRDLERHRLMTWHEKENTVEYGVAIPEFITEMGTEEEFLKPIRLMEDAFYKVQKKYPHLADYCITRAHLKPMLCKFNLREAYHLVRLRTAPNAHQWIRYTFADAYEKMKKVHPKLWKKVKVSEKLLKETRNISKIS